MPYECHQARNGVSDTADDGREQRVYSQREWV
jgi:hypothetical protein